MRAKMNAGYGMSDLLLAGCGIKIILIVSAKAEFAQVDRRDGDSFKTDGGMRVDTCPSQRTGARWHD